jgi:hypothetical protein
MTMPLTPGDEAAAEQEANVRICREAISSCEQTLALLLPEGTDKDYVLRKFREIEMWVTLAVFRYRVAAPNNEQENHG